MTKGLPLRSLKKEAQTFRVFWKVRSGDQDMKAKIRLQICCNFFIFSKFVDVRILLKLQVIIPSFTINIFHTITWTTHFVLLFNLTCGVWSKVFLSLSKLQHTIYIVEGYCSFISIFPFLVICQNIFRHKRYRSDNDWFGTKCMQHLVLFEILVSTTIQIMCISNQVMLLSSLVT